MSIIRNKLKSEYSQIPNTLITDSRVSNGAKLVMIYLLTLPDYWQINNADVMNKLNIKRQETLKNYWDELVCSGWIFRERLKGDKGRFGNFTYTLHNDLEIPDTNNPCLEPTTISPVPEKPLLRKNRTYNNTKEQEHSNTNINNTYIEKENIKEKEIVIKSTKAAKQGTESAINDIIAHYCDKTGRNVSTYQEVSKNLITLLKTHSINECKLVIDYVIKDDWYINNKFDTLSVIFRPTKFNDKLERANIYLFNKNNGIVGRKQLAKEIKEELRNSNNYIHNPDDIF